MKHALIPVVVALIVTASACVPPIPDVPILQRKELELKGAKGLVLSVRGALDAPTVQDVVDAYKSGFSVVRVVSYPEVADVGMGYPIARYTWTSVDGLKKDF